MPSDNFLVRRFLPGAAGRIDPGSVCGSLARDLAPQDGTPQSGTPAAGADPPCLVVARAGYALRVAGPTPLVGR